jgi:hypothetical protein
MSSEEQQHETNSMTKKRRTSSTGLQQNGGGCGGGIDSSLILDRMIEDNDHRLGADISQKANDCQGLILTSETQQQQQQQQQGEEEPTGIASMEEFLGLPVEIIFRRIVHRSHRKRGHGKPLMTRTEASVFLKVTLLAQELDVLIRLTERVANQQRQAKQLYETIVCNARTVNPWLTPIIPLMYTLLHPPPFTIYESWNGLASSTTTNEKARTTTSGKSETARQQKHHRSAEKEMEGQHDDSNTNTNDRSNNIVSSTLFDVHASIAQLAESLQDCSVQLMQASEQNWALVDSLLDIADATTSSSEDEDEADTRRQFKTKKEMSATQTLAREKQALAELQEHVARRIDNILMLQYDESSNVLTTTNSSSSSSCRVLFGGRTSPLMDDHQGSQMTTTRGTGSQLSARSSTGSDDRLLSADASDLSTPLSSICQELFGEEPYSDRLHGNAKGNTHGGARHSPPMQQSPSATKENDDINSRIDHSLSDKHNDRGGSQGSSSYPLISSPMNNTQHAATAMLSLIHNERKGDSTTAIGTTKASVDRVALEKESGNNRLSMTDRTSDSTTSSATSGTAHNNQNEEFEYSSGSQEQQRNDNLSQFVKVSAAEALTRLVNGDLK